jgi:F0F1-type ATP synthase epsilon subunit
MESPAKGKPYFESIAKIADVLGLSMERLPADCCVISERSHRGQKLDSAELEKAQDGAVKAASHMKAASTELSASIRLLNVARRRTKR